MSGAPDTYLGAVVDFDLALEAAREILAAKVDDSTLDVDTSDILVEGDDGVVRVDKLVLADLLDRLEEASRAIRDAHNNFNWNVGQALLDLKIALANAPSTTVPHRDSSPPARPSEMGIHGQAKRS
jgi:hypothetical protein